MPRLTLIVPESCLQAAKIASKAFDPDVGGEDAFQVVEADGRYSYTVDASPEYAEAFTAFKLYPELLLQSIELDFAQRFPDATPPSLEALTAFCQQVEINPEGFCTDLPDLLPLAESPAESLKDIVDA